MTYPLVLGTMYFGTRIDEATSYAILDRFVDAGGRTIDTANCYAFWASETGSGGQSETVVGNWLAHNTGVRDRLTIATKVGQEPRTPGRFEPWEGLSAATIAGGFERSRERLGIETIDLYWAHGEDRTVDLDETIGAFGELTSSGRVRRVGFSNHPTWRVERARSLATTRKVEPASALQLTTSYVRPRPDTSVPGKDHRFGFVTDETLDYVSAHHEVELWAYSPLIQGSYVRTDRPLPEQYEHPGTTDRLAALTEVADELRATTAQVVLAWLAASTPPIRPIVGVSTLAQLDGLLPAADLELDDDQLTRLDAAG